MQQRKYLDVFQVKPVLNKKLTNHLRMIKQSLDKFFGVKLEQPYICLVQNRREYNLLNGCKTPHWSVGWYRNSAVFIMDYKVYTKESDHKNQEGFWHTLKHELCHYYYRQLTGTSYPRWLNEGLACFVSKQKMKTPERAELLKVFKYFKHTDYKIYRIGYFLVKLLVKKFGRPKLIALLKTLNKKTTKKQFANNFYKIYKISYSKEGFSKLLD